MEDQGKFVVLSHEGIALYFVQCPFCAHLNYVETPKSYKVMRCYGCDKQFIQPCSTAKWEWK